MWTAVPVWCSEQGVPELPRIWIREEGDQEYKDLSSSNEKGSGQMQSLANRETGSVQTWEKLQSWPGCVCAGMHPCVHSQEEAEPLQPPRSHTHGALIAKHSCKSLITERSLLPTLSIRGGESKAQSGQSEFFTSARRLSGNSTPSLKST